MEKYYETEIFLMESSGADYVRIKWKMNPTGTYGIVPTTGLTNLLPSESLYFYWQCRVKLIG